MDKRIVVDWIRSLTDKQFVELLYEASAGRWTAGDDGPRIVLAQTRKTGCEGIGPATWEIALLCGTPDQDWVDDAPICQEGVHCGFPTMSWAKRSTCPVCGGTVSGT